MTLRKSKAIKKVKLEMQEAARKNAPKNQQKVVIKQVEKRAQALKNINSKFKKYAHITAKKLNIDEETIQKAVDSLRKYYKTNNDGDDKLYLVAELATAPQITEAQPIQIRLSQPIHQKIGFIVHGDIMEDFQKRFLQYKVMSQNTYYSKEAEDRKMLGSLDLILVDYVLYNKLISKKPSKKLFPFHPSKVPFEVKKHYAIQEYNDYIGLLISSTFTFLKNQTKQSIPIARLHSFALDQFRQNAIDFVAKIFAQAKGNSVIHLYLKTSKSIELLIY